MPNPPARLTAAVSRAPETTSIGASRIGYRTPRRAFNCVLIGIAVQLVFIALITPGGAVPADLSFASYLGIPLAMVGGATPQVAVSLAVAFGAIGVAAWQVLSVDR